jgi:hypothetical protein
MARTKKSKRPNLPAETLERARAELRGEAPVTSITMAPVDGVQGEVPSQPKKVKRSSADSLTVRKIPTEAELIEEYRYVYSDLRKMVALVAVLLVIGVIVGALILPRIITVG